MSSEEPPDSNAAPTPTTLIDRVSDMAPYGSDRAVALVGFMGIGKTTVGGELARRLGWPLLDTDRLIEQRSNMTVREIFDWFGESRFRELERDVVAAHAGLPRQVLALGGGAFIPAINRDLLLDGATVIYLAAPWSYIARSVQRLKNTRPLLRERSVAELEALFHTRHVLYDLAPVRVAVPGRTPRQVADRILAMLATIQRP